MEGNELGSSLGCDDGMADTEGLNDGRELGAELIDGDSEGNDEGWLDVLGFIDGWVVGAELIDGAREGCSLGNEEGIDEGDIDMEGDRLGCSLG